MNSVRNLRLALLSVMICLAAHGQTWTQSNATNGSVWYSMAGSQRGSNLVAAILSDDPINFSTPGQIYASTNGGQTWQLTSAPDNYWISVASSADGQRLVAGAYTDPTSAPGQIFISTNGSLTWTACSNAPAENWQAVASSADGQILVGATYYNYLGFPIWFVTHERRGWFS